MLSGRPYRSTIKAAAYNPHFVSCWAGTSGGKRTHYSSKGESQED